jgi:hypothetical protein
VPGRERAAVWEKNMLEFAVDNFNDAGIEKTPPLGFSAPRDAPRIRVWGVLVRFAKKQVRSEKTPPLLIRAWHA